MPTFAQENAASSSPKTGFWRSFVVASPNPSTLPGGRQLDQAPMCPCLECWESGSPYHVSRPKTPKEKKQPKQPKPATAATPSRFKKSPLLFLKRNNGSFMSLASDMSPLRKEATQSTASVYSRDY